MSKTPCPICREEHEPKPLSYDGMGINACGMYASRIATFANESNRDLLGPIFASAPDLLMALHNMVKHYAPEAMSTDLSGNSQTDAILRQAVTALRKARVNK